MMNEEIATFAGGCFWCMVKPFDTLPGIRQVVSGYCGGHTANPTYEQVKSGTTGHMESVQITFEPDVFPYEKLLDLFWQHIDPTDDGGQFIDRGSNYRTAIFYHNKRQKQLAELSKHALAVSGRFRKPIVTRILPAAPFYPAETEHQRFYRKNPRRYEQEIRESGRQAFIEDNWR